MKSNSSFKSEKKKKKEGKKKILFSSSLFLLSLYRQKKKGKTKREERGIKKEKGKRLFLATITGRRRGISNGVLAWSFDSWVRRQRGRWRRRRRRWRKSSPSSSEGVESGWVKSANIWIRLRVIDQRRRVDGDDVIGKLCADFISFHCLLVLSIVTYRNTESLPLYVDSSIKWGEG